MPPSSPAPEIYWVVGSGTDVGKTTVATALIRVLNSQGRRTVGFKPFAASLLQDLVDFMIEKYPGSPSKLFGKDAWKLATASPLTGPDMVDLVVPAQILCYPFWPSAVLVRSGSASLGNVEYFCSEQGAKLKNRQDLQRIIKKSGLPFDQAQVTEKLTIGYGARRDAEKKQRAFNALLGLGVDAVVCEGAGSWLPIWPECPTVNHLFVVANGAVSLYPDLGRKFDFRSDRPLREAGRLQHSLNRSDTRKVSSPLYLAQSARHDEIASTIVSQLLIKSEVLPQTRARTRRAQLSDTA